VESVESLVDLLNGVEQMHGQPQIAFAICGIDSAVRELMVTLLSSAVFAGKHNQGGSCRTPVRADELILRWFDRVNETVDELLVPCGDAVDPDL
jgi:hypothetical protein